MDYRLSSIERNFAEEHHNLVYAFLNRKKLSEKDFYDIAALAYLKAVRRYFINKNLEKYNFSTVAWKAMESAVNKEQRKEKSIFRRLEDTFGLERGDTFIDSFGHEDNFDEKMVYMELRKKLKPYLTEKQEKTLCKVAEGYKYSDLAKEAGITKSGIGSRLSRARRNARLILIKGEE